MKKLVILSLLVLIVSVLNADIYHYSVTYMGIPVTNVEIIHRNNDYINTIKARATSKGLVSAFFRLHNRYISYCDSNYIPFRFHKAINQQNLVFDKLIEFNREQDSITVIDNITDQELAKFYHTMPVYDLISFAFASADSKAASKSFFVISDFDIWEFTLSYLQEEYIHTAGKNFICDKYQVKMKRVYDNSIEQATDVLTNNLFDEKTKLFVWYSADNEQIPVKMKFRKLIFSVVLELQKI